ncbi:hydrolase [Lentzea sp. NBRC 105346]|uniref:alpha/beta fold hydrolase n=1 Tax=Lentzea sp. NBRC 105346 TaxID=3032205 RepID=UPI0024A56EF3|nr:alpha/beta hydrolase [Lentzea sp. NBRC 105346]GLZ28498.1 hydrolase [Lentzea sp. NBRC 105346]
MGVTADGIHYEDVGDGPVTLFVHGVFTNGRLWRNCVRLLFAHRRCITVDLPGHGLTPPLGDPSVWGLADAVDSVIRELDLRDIALVGNDTGGAVAQVVLTRDPSRFTSFALTNCDTEGNFPPAAFRPAVFGARLGLLRLAGFMTRMPWLARQIYRLGYENPSSIPDDVITGYLTPVLAAPRFMEQLLASMNPTSLREIRPQLASCTVPTVLVWGTGDIFFHLDWAHWLRRLIPGATEVVEVPGGRLFFVDERAPELVAALEKHWGPSAE